MLQQAIGQVLSFGVGVAISPVPIIAVVLMLGTPRARSNGPAFLVGWIVGLAIVGAIVLLVAGSAGADDDGGTSGGVAWVKIVLGLVLMLLALRQWRSRPHGGQQGELPKWMAAIDQFGPPKAAGIAVVLSAVNPKNLLLTVGAGLAISQTGASTGDEVVALAVFILIATLGVAAPIVIFFAMGERAVKLLDGMKTWLGANNNAVMAVLFLVLGAKLLGDGITIA